MYCAGQLYCSFGERDFWNPDLDSRRVHLHINCTRHHGRREVHCPRLYHSRALHGSALCDRLYSHSLHEQQFRLACSQAHCRVCFQSCCSR